jgi:hypothetical protein
MGLTEEVEKSVPDAIRLILNEIKWIFYFFLFFLFFYYLLLFYGIFKKFLIDINLFSYYTISLPIF